MKTFTLLFAATLITTSALAQPVANSNNNTRIMKKEGKVWIVEPMQQSQIMNNGLVVRPSGVVKTAQGKIFTLNNGDCIGVDGKIVGLNEKNITSVFIRNGKMWKLTLLDEPLVLTDGVSVLENGTIIKNGAKIIQLKNDEIINIANNESATWKPSNIMVLNQ